MNFSETSIEIFFDDQLNPDSFDPSLPELLHKLVAKVRNYETLTIVCAFLCKCSFLKRVSWPCSNFDFALLHVWKRCQKRRFGSLKAVY